MTILPAALPRAEPPPAANKELTTIDSVRQFMQKSLKLSKDLQDDDIEILISQVSEVLPRYCNREFTPTNEATRSFEWTPRGVYDVLDLVPYEIRTITSVQIDPEIELGTYLTNVQYRLRPNPSRDGTYFALRLSGLALPKLSSTLAEVGYPYAFYTRRVDISGNWGMAQVPREVEHYANLIVESWLHLRRDGGMSVGESPGESPLRAEDIPPAARFGLRRWMRPEPLI